MKDQPMRAVEIVAPGGPDALELCERPVPEPGPGEVLIKIAYAGVNGPDVHQRKGLYRAPADASDLPGLEASGQVAGIGPGVSGFQIGDAVCALLPGGGYAEFATTHARHCLPIPSGLSLEQAAALPEKFFTVWSNVFMSGRLRAGQTFLVHGGTGGIGSTAIQLGTAFGARVFATAGSDQKVALCEQLGAERAINYREEDFVEVLRKSGRADLILDIVGGDYIQRNIKALKDEGRLQMIAFQTGAKAQIGFGEVMLRRLTLSGTTLRPQSIEAKARIAGELLTNVWPLLNAGSILPLMAATFPLESASDAHIALEGDHIGNIVLKVS